MNKEKNISIVVPVYQNEKNLNVTIPSLLSLQEKLPSYNLELVFVDDGSTDNSYNILTKFHKLYQSKIKVVKLTRNFGQTPAIQAGLREAKGNCIGIISADLQDPYELFINMVAKWEEGTKVIIAERKYREENVRHVLMSNLFWRMINKYAVKNIPKGGFDFCLIDKQVRDDVIKINEKNVSIFPFIFWLGYNYDIIHYTRRIRTKGVSQWTLSDKIKLTIDTFVGFSYLPIRVISYIGIGTSLLSFLYTLFIILRMFLFGIPIQGWATIVTLISFIGGITLLSLGIIGEYLWRLLDETKKRPNFVIERINDNEKSN